MDTLNSLTSWTTITGAYISGNVSCTCGLPNCYGYWHYFPQSTDIVYINNQTAPKADFEIRKVENGYILNRSYNEYVFETLENMLRFIKQESKKNK